MYINLYILTMILLIIVILIIKIYIIRKSIKEINEAFIDRLKTDTNTVIDISCNDKYIRDLADTINKELKILRKEHNKFYLGDIELKNAITNISHDLRTPLTAINGYLDLLAYEDKSETVNRYIGIIKNRTDLMKQLTEELFRYSIIVSSKEDNKKELTIVNDVLEESIAAFYGAFIEAKLIPNIKITKKNIVKNISKSDLTRIFSNLLNNIIKYSDGKVEILLRSKGDIIFRNSTDKLNEIQVGRIFDRFYTVENARNSTGLGLSITKLLVEKANGNIVANYKNAELEIKINFPEI